MVKTSILAVLSSAIIVVSIFITIRIRNHLLVPDKFLSHIRQQSEKSVLRFTKSVKVFIVKNCGSQSMFCRGYNRVSSCMSYCQPFPPHSLVHQAFLSQVNEAKEWSKADLMWIPVDFAAMAFMEFLSNDTARNLDTMNKKFCSWWSARATLFPDLGTPYFIIWNYVFYQFNVSCVPRHIHILAFENSGHTGPPSDSEYENGCDNRCVIIPYPTSHSRQRSALFPGKYPVWMNAEYKDYGWEPRLPHNYTNVGYNRKYAISFIGSIDRNPTLIRFRQSLVNSVKNHFRERYGTVTTSVGANPATQNAVLDIFKNSNCCLILRGDTTTRHSFYSSILEGCIPVIYESSLRTYGQLLGGGFNVRAASIILPDSLWMKTNDVKLALAILSQNCASSASGSRASMLQKIANAILYKPMPKNTFNNAVSLSLNAILDFKKKRKLLYMAHVPNFFNIDMIAGKGIQISHGDGFSAEINASFIHEPFMISNQLRKAAFGEKISHSFWKEKLKPKVLLSGNFEFHVTSQYALELLLHCRMLEHPLRTQSISSASLIVVPVYLFCSQWHKVPGTCSQTDAAKMLQDAAVIVKKLPRHIPILWMFGDVLWSKESYFLQLANVQFFENWYILALEADIKNGYKNIPTGNVIQMPYPVVAHATTNYKYENYTTSPRLDKMFVSTEDRKHLVCYFGRNRWPINLNIRGNLTDEVKIVQINLSGWKTLRTEMDFRRIYSLYSNCEFSLTPYGDMATRKSFYDSLMLGSIPVVFPENANEYANVFSHTYPIDLTKMFLKVPKFPDYTFWEELLNHLRGIKKEKIQSMRKYIFKKFRSLQYSWVYDEHDALEIAFDAVLKLHERKLK